MARRTEIQKKTIVDTAYAIVRKDGKDVLTARSLASALGCSTQPIFRSYSSMAALLKDVTAKAAETFEEFLRKRMAKAKLPFKESGLAYITFAQKEENLFRLLFMSETTATYANATEALPTGNPALNLQVQRQSGLSKEHADLLLLECWIFVHGIAVMIATHALAFDEAILSRMLSDQYLGIVEKFRKEEKEKHD
jgi:AcrR family transcriptional regulator